jgi:hypothetical protein
MTKREYDERYKRPITGFARVEIQRDKKTFLFSGETWLLIALIIGCAAVMVSAALLPGLSFSWGFAGLLARIAYGLALSAGLPFVAIKERHKHKRLWTYILSLVFCAAIAVGLFVYNAVPAIRDLGEKPVIRTFTITGFERFGRYARKMVAVDAETGRVVEFPVAIFSREEKMLGGELSTVRPVVTITYYPHSKVRAQMEY